MKRGYYKASDIAKKLIKDFKDVGVKVSKDDAMSMIPDKVDGKTLEEMLAKNEADKAAARLANRIFGEVVEKAKKDDPLATMVNNLLGKFKEKDITEGGKKAERKTDIQKISEALNNKEKYKDAWKEAKDKAIKRVDGDKTLTEEAKKKAKNRIKDAYSKATEFTFTEAQAKRAIRKQFRDIGEKINDVIRSAADKKAVVRERIKQDLIEEAGVSEKDAKILSKAIDKAYASLMSDGAQKLVDRYIDKAALKQKTSKDPKLAKLYKQQVRAKKSSIEELIELVNAGALDSERFREVFSDANGLAMINDEAIKQIRKSVGYIQDLPSAGMKARASEDLLGYMKNLEGVSWREIGDFVWFSHNLSGVGTQIFNNIVAEVNVRAGIAAQALLDPVAWHQMIKGYRRGRKMGINKAKDVMKHGYSEFESKVETPMVGERTDFRQVVNWSF